ncbi:MAG: tetratricopeptide repeat protein [bacterium]|nr:tetratricopeptide repeat protein [bacterium]
MLNNNQTFSSRQTEIINNTLSQFRQQSSNVYAVAVKSHRAGDYAAAENGYRQILQNDPANHEVIHLLGMVAYQTQKYDIAGQYIAEAIGICSENPDYHLNLGNVHKQKRDYHNALKCYKKVIEMQPRNHEAFFNCGIACQYLGRNEACIEYYRKALELDPEYAYAHNNLGNALKDMGQTEAAVEHFKAAVRIKPDYAFAYNNLANLLNKTGRFDEAFENYKNAIEHDAGYPEPHYNVGLYLHYHKKSSEAEKHFREAIRLKPDYADAYCALGFGLFLRNKIMEAIDCYEKAIEYRPDFSDAYNALGAAHDRILAPDKALQCYEEALRHNPGNYRAWCNIGMFYKNQKKDFTLTEKYLKKALRYKPDLDDALNNLAITYKDQGRLEESYEDFNEILTRLPQFASAHSNLLLNLHYHNYIDNQYLFEEHRRWASVHSSELGISAAPFQNRPVPDRPLRIGYISPDFKSHSVAKFLLPVIKAHDRTNFKIYCYSDVLIHDPVSTKFVESADVWIDTFSLADSEFCERIRNDGIDILVDLTGHTAHNRMLVFACKPAPVQVAWLGYPDTTGLDTIDYRLTDSYADPPGMTEEFHTETLVRFDAGFLSYGAEDHYPDVGDLPALNNGYVTFGSFNNTNKVSPDVIALWSKILKAVPESRIVLKSTQLEDADTKKRFAGWFEDNGISPNRVELLGRIKDIEGHLDIYNRIDIALDPFPYNGTTTSIEALWMGVPFITLAGDRHAARVGVSILYNIDLPALIADTPDYYVQLAAALADNLDKLSGLRSTMRQRLLQSPLMDTTGFTRELENEYRKMWVRWCGEQNVEDRSQNSEGKKKLSVVGEEQETENQAPKTKSQISNKINQTQSTKYGLSTQDSGPSTDKLSLRTDETANSDQLSAVSLNNTEINASNELPSTQDSGPRTDETVNSDQLSAFSLNNTEINASNELLSDQEVNLSLNIPALSTDKLSLSTQHPGPSTDKLSLSTQHSALSTDKSVVS